jgi:hypothetical protein
VTDTLELPDGSVVEGGEVFLYNDYPYRYVPGDGADTPTTAESGSTAVDGESAAAGGESTVAADHTTAPVDGEPPAFHLSPLYWGGGEMDVPFRDREALREQWEPDASGVLDDDGWEAWLADAREADQFGEAELDAVARELFDDQPAGAAADRSSGLLDRLRGLFS